MNFLSKLVFIALFMALLSPIGVKAQDIKDDEGNKKPPVDWVLVESTGTLSSAKAGALEKTLWKDQKRSDIEFLLLNLPTRIELRSVLDLQRRLLLSATDSALIDNDIGPLRGSDLLIKRIIKLMDMGLYDDAWALYTQKAEEPYDVSIAQLGMLLLIMKNDMATACLEEKVLSTRFTGDEFFGLLDKACSLTLGSTQTPQFPENKILQAVYNDKDFTVFAKSFEALEKMNNLERAVVFANGKIRYDGLTSEILDKTPSRLVALYLMDKALPESALLLVTAEMNKRGLSWHTLSLAKGGLLKRARDLSKDPEDQWPILEQALVEKTNPADLVPFAGMISGSTPEKLSTETIVNVLGALLASHTPLSDFWIKEAQKAAAEKPIVYIYLQAFKSLTATKDIEIDNEKLMAALKSLKQADLEQVLGVIGTLDKNASFLKNSLAFYEKPFMLTSAGSYVMPNRVLISLLDTALEKKQIGITVLAVLNGLALKPDTIYSDTMAKSLYSMLNVGLIEDAETIGAETIATVLNKY